MTGPRRPRGVSLAEALVAGSLLAVIFGVVLFLLMPGYRAWTRGQRKTDVQQNALVIVGRITQEFQNAHAGSVFVNHLDAYDIEGNPARHDSLIFLSDLDDYGNLSLTEDGDPLWQKRVVFYHDGDTQQIRSIAIPLDPPATEPDPILVKTFQPSDKDRIVARFVRSFALSYVQAPTLQVIVETMHDKFTSGYESSITPLLVTFVPPTPSPSP